MSLVHIPCRSLCWISRFRLPPGVNKHLRRPARAFSDDSSRDDSKKNTNVVEQPENGSKAKEKLDGLLKSIIKDQETKQAETKPEDTIALNLARPIKKKLSEEELKTLELDKKAEKEIGQEMFKAVKNVAESLKTEKVEDELVEKLKSHTIASQLDLNKIFTGMKIESTKQKEEDLSRASQVKKMIPPERFRPSDRRRPREFLEKRKSPYIPTDIFGAKPLGIFSDDFLDPKNQKVPYSYLQTWEKVQQKELKLAVTHPPANGFEEMIAWTEQGKLWHFPINNEQGLDEEANVSFSDHVFLEPHIESWCPEKGPIRHFMELVCLGLSKNPYLTVEEKKDHIEWYHQYFKGKANVIKSIGAGEIK